MSIEPAACSGPPRVGLVAAQNITPFGQGDLDGLCGLYSIINALRLLAALGSRRLTDTQCERLFRAGIDHLDAHGRLAYGAGWGMSLSRWRRLTDRLCATAGRMLGCPILVERPFKPRLRPPAWAVFAAIGEALERQSPVLVLLRGSYDHFTVVSALTAGRLRLFDSYGYRWITRRACSCGATDPPRRHRLACASVTILSMDAPHGRL